MAHLFLTDCDPFGKIKSVSVDKGGRFTELPQIRMNTETGLNASFVPNFDIIRDPQPVDPVITQMLFKSLILLG